jgi:hypothetical protein
LGAYLWSSYPAYLVGVDEYAICDPKEMLKMVGGRERYEKFTTSFADYEKAYKMMKKQMIDA